MAEEVLIEQFHVDVYVPERVPEPQAEAARRVLDSARFRRRVEHALRVLLCRHCGLHKVRLRLSA